MFRAVGTGVRREVQGGTSTVWIDLDLGAKREREMTGKAVDSAATSIIINQC